MNPTDAPSDPAFQIDCPACGNPIVAPESMRGSTVQCPHQGCGARIQLPGAAKVVGPAPGETAKRVVVRRPLSSVPPSGGDAFASPARPSKKKTTSPAPFIIGGVALLGAVTAVVIAMNRPKDAPAPTAVQKPVAAQPAATPAPATRAKPPVSPANPATNAPPATVATGPEAKPPPRPGTVKPGELTEEQRRKLNERFTSAAEQKKKETEEKIASMTDKASAGDLDAMLELGQMYATGEAGAKDPAKAREWLGKAAAKDVPQAHLALGQLESGENNSAVAAKAYLKAGELAAKAAREGDEKARDVVQEALNGLARMGAADEYYALVAILRGGQMNILGSGTGWFIDASHVVTCEHVVSKFDPARHRLFIQSDTIPKTEISVLKASKENDVAVLKLADPVPNMKGIRVTTREVHLGTSAFTIGYPHITELGKSAKYHDGKISALAGAEDSARDYTISVPVQPGNSGGPLLNRHGEGIGVIVAQMRGLQNVNYAVKASVLIDFLKSVPWKPNPAQQIRETPQEMEEAVPLVQKAVVIVLVENK